MRVFSFEIRRLPTDPPQTPSNSLERLEMVEKDALHLVTRHFQGRDWTRRRAGMSQRRWNKAYTLLKLSDVVDERGWVIALDRQHAIHLIGAKCAEYRFLLRNRYFTLPF